MASSTKQLPETSRLLSLPKELCLEIWKYTLTDPAIDRVKQGFLRLLLKIKAPRTFNCLVETHKVALGVLNSFSEDEDARFQEMLHEEKRDFEAEAEAITVQNPYQNYSFEEWRVADYKHGRRYC